MRAFIATGILVLSTGAAFAGGDSGYRPEYFQTNANLSGICSERVGQAERGLSHTHAANLSTAEKLLNQARTARSAGKGQECIDRAQDAMHWEQ